MVRVRHTTIYRTNLGALGAVMEANALGTLLRVDNVDCLPLADCVVGTFWFTSPTANAFVSNLIRHEECLLLTWGIPPFIKSFTA